MNARTKSKRAAVRYQYQAVGILKRVDVDDIAQLTQDHIDLFRDMGQREGLSAVTIEAYIKGASILTGKKFGGEKLRIPQKRPTTIPLENLSKLYASVRDRNGRNGRWFRCLLRFGFVTALRHHDLTGLTRDNIKDDAIEVEASKTRKLHVIPKHALLNYRLPEGDRPLYRNVQTVQKWLKRECERAGIPHFTLQALRRTAALEYEKAWPGAGGILLGHSLGNITFAYYIDQYEVLRKAQERLAIPAAMMPKERPADPGPKRKRQMNKAFKSLDVGSQEALLKIAQTMAGGAQ